MITHSTKLDSDLGPCPGNGLVVRADNITLDLGGHAVSAANGPEETVGIRLGNVNGVTVRNGTVKGFDAGVDVEGGSRNRIEKITARDNVNDMMEPFPFTPGTPPPAEQLPMMLCDYGDGITTTDSDSNVIQHNKVVHNGPYAGISLVDDSDQNLVSHNVVLNNNVPNQTTSFAGQAVSGLCGATLPGAPGMQRGRPIQDIGVRIEGSGADENRIVRNRVDNSALAGISIHSWVCHPEPGEPRMDQQPNLRNLIQGNRVMRTGAETHEIDSFADGIAVLASGPIGEVTCTSYDNTIRSNRVFDNLRHGISLGTTTYDNMVAGNVALRNAVEGLLVEEQAHDNSLSKNRAHGNGEYDGRDDNEACDANAWRDNVFRTVNQPCVAAGRLGSHGGRGNSEAAPRGTNGAMKHPR
ncbi:MAG: right-handed parallel beta-helix repeat-containing protein [Mycobacteriales bacterium]